MGRGLVLPLYLAFSERADRFAERRLARRMALGKEDAGRMGERRGIASADRPDGDVLWFHAASVGEALSILELVRRLIEEDEWLNFLITTGTVASAQVLENRLPPEAIHQYIPLDAASYVRAFLDHWQPDLAVWTESELWPALMEETHSRGIPMLLLNGRISQSSYRRWRLTPSAISTLLGYFKAAHVQDQATAQHLARLGMASDRISITGTLKEGSAALPDSAEAREEVAQMIAGRPTWLAASTHAPEEEMVAQAHRIVMRRSPRMLLILAPRDPDRGGGVAASLRASQLRVAQRSKFEKITDETEIYLADCPDELGIWYRLAPLSFVGGSLVPVGGHNPLEPAALGSAILHGPHVGNFKEIYDRLAVAEGAVRVSSEGELTNQIVRMLAPDQAAAMAHAAWEVSSSGAEVTNAALSLILDTLGGAT